MAISLTLLQNIFKNFIPNFNENPLKILISKKYFIIYFININNAMAYIIQYSFQFYSTCYKISLQLKIYIYNIYRSIIYIFQNRVQVQKTVTK